MPALGLRKFVETRLDGICLTSACALTSSYISSDPQGNMPKTAEEFDRLVMASPNDGSLWVRYMAHHLQQLEIEKARQIAQRGLKLIKG